MAKKLIYPFIIIIVIVAIIIGIGIFYMENINQPTSPNNVEKIKTIKLEGYTIAGEGSEWNMEFNSEGNLKVYAKGGTGAGGFAVQDESEKIDQKITEEVFKKIEEIISRYNLIGSADQPLDLNKGREDRYALIGFSEQKIYVNNEQPAFKEINDVFILIKESVKNSEIKNYFQNFLNL